MRLSGGYNLSDSKPALKILITPTYFGMKGSLELSSHSQSSSTKKHNYPDVGDRTLEPPMVLPNKVRCPDSYWDLIETPVRAHFQ